MIKTRKRNRRNDKPSAVKTARLEARLTEQQKAMIERAADYEGRSVTDFVVHAVSQAAKMVIQEQEVVRLDRTQSLAFVKGLLGSGEPNNVLQAAAKKYRRSLATR